MLGLYRVAVTTGMFVVRMAILGLMILLQWAIGGAEIRPVSKEAAATPTN